MGYGGFNTRHYFDMVSAFLKLFPIGCIGYNKGANAENVIAVVTGFTLGCFRNHVQLNYL